jgi:hypothetical protein
MNYDAREYTEQGGFHPIFMRQLCHFVKRKHYLILVCV